MGGGPQVAKMTFELRIVYQLRAERAYGCKANALTLITGKKQGGWSSTVSDTDKASVIQSNGIDTAEWSEW